MSIFLLLSMVLLLWKQGTRIIPVMALGEVLLVLHMGLAGWPGAVP
ncbi:MAG: hypothetical protein M3O22_03920 [Pseudomonadota bacterium]|nr:hypothetical protein [Pseudomonadota bacterium]